MFLSFGGKLKFRYVLDYWWIWVVASYVGFSDLARADEPCIAVFYPQVREPYRKVLEEIMTGIEEGAANWAVHRLPIPDSDNRDAAEASAAPFGCRAVIGLGRAGVQAVTPFVSKISVTAGAVLMQPGKPTAIPTVSFAPNSAELFTRLKHFLPAVKTVTVVFDPSRSGGLVEKAAKSADSLGIKLVALEARNLSDAAILYKRILDESDPKTDAIWLLRDASVMDSGAVLTLVLKHAWKRKLVVFSNQLTHVKQGVLFSVYPDNDKLGARLAKLARDCVPNNCNDRGVMALRDLGTAVNIRTANRLGIDIDRRHDPYVDLVLPAN